MPHFDLAYLRSLLEETKAKRNQFAFFEPDEEGSEVTYLPSKLRIYWAGRIDSPYFQYEMEKCGVKESPKLRKNTQNYFRIVRKDGRLLRIDSFVKGRLTDILIIHYEGNQRYAFPFRSSGAASPTHTQVVTFQNGYVTEDYMVGNVQIVYRSYQTSDDGRINYHKINYIPTGDYPINGISAGYFSPGEKMVYTETNRWAWFMEPDQAGLEAQIRVIPDCTFNT